MSDTVRARFRQLAGGEIVETAERLRARINERFPDSGLSQVASELLGFASESAGLLDYLGRPLWAIRVGVGVILAGMAGVLIMTLASIGLPSGAGGPTEVLQAAEAAFSLLVFLGAVVLFLVTLETRLKRGKALRALHQLRSLAHVVDMHQLTKDPERFNDPHTLAAVNDIESLTSGLSGKIWQKITLLERA